VKLIVNFYSVLALE